MKCRNIVDNKIIWFGKVSDEILPITAEDVTLLSSNIGERITRGTTINVNGTVYVIAGVPSNGQTGTSKFTSMKPPYVTNELAAPVGMLLGPGKAIYVKQSSSVYVFYKDGNYLRLGILHGINKDRLYESVSYNVKAVNIAGDVLRDVKKVDDIVVTFLSNKTYIGTLEEPFAESMVFYDSHSANIDKSISCSSVLATKDKKIHFTASDGYKRYYVIFNPKSRTYETTYYDDLSNTPTMIKGSDGTKVQVGDIVYSFGGSGGMGYLHRMIAFDILTKTETVVNDFPITIGQFGCGTVVDDSIILLSSDSYQNSYKIDLTTVAKQPSYVDRQQAVASSLTQRLSVIRGELWYNVSYGIPLLEKIKSKSIIDATVIQIVSSHQDVNDIKDFYSYIDRHSYHCKMTVMSKYGPVDLQI